ncbi:CBS domain-containing protein [Stieleria sp. JC731]|uniref:CBS domain-containing protein n=1 Tax=Pirellulaceae TaxID=2691357 RepID=UPI001E4DF20D|nr:CBS domain-containing protein [Stieleria sp. JC731]MCC9603979.1 CBS domain-containing protein [Stieleria sp. JC731]
MNQYHRFDAPDPLPDPLSDYDRPEYRDSTAEHLGEHQVNEINHHPYLTIDAEATVEQAIDLLHKEGVSSLLVLRDDKLVGIFTERDVLEKIAERYNRVRLDLVEDYMTNDPTIVYSGVPAAAAVAAIAIAGHRHVPVLNMDDEIVGIVSPRRVFQFVETSWQS